MQPITVGIVGANRITVGPTVVASEMGCFREEPIWTNPYYTMTACG